MASIKPGPKVWTIRFKIHKTTVLLYVEPTQRLSAIKRDLLTALRETHPSNQLQLRDCLRQLPDDAGELQLAKLVDTGEDSMSWERIDCDEAEHGLSSNKGKEKTSNVTANGQESKETAQNVGLVDGSIVAVRLSRSSGSDDVLIDIDDAGWDVVFPSQEADEVEDMG